MQKTPKKPKELFAPVPISAIADKRLTALDHRVLEAVAYHDRFGRNGIGCSATHKRIAMLVGAHITNVTKSIARLISLGYLVSQKSGRDGRRRIYHVVYNDEDSEAFDGASTNKNMAISSKLLVHEQPIAGAEDSSSDWKNRDSAWTIYSHKGQYKNTGSGTEEASVSLSESDKREDLEKLIDHAGSCLSVRAREATDGINREIDSASDILADSGPSGAIQKPSSAQPSSALLNSPLSRKARGVE